ncbi:MAG: glycosyltransferase family 39 protein, partial [Gemmatimonadota bacterium]|nr:glycosyltransferase family 39 protein [Gemmatimonadota bacterium]
MPHREWPWSVATVIVLLGLLLFNIDGYALLDPDEGRNAEVMREMAATNDYVVPQLNGLPYVDKPALYFAVGALGMEILGPTVRAARLPSLLFTLATLMVVGVFAYRLYGRHAAWVAIVATAATPFMLAYSRTVIFDSALMFWVVVSVMGFFESIEGGGKQRGATDKGQEIPDTSNEDRSIWWRAMAWGAMGLGVLTKGPIALALPLMIVLPYA